MRTPITWHVFSRVWRYEARALVSRAVIRGPRSERNRYGALKCGRNSTGAPRDGYSISILVLDRAKPGGISISGCSLVRCSNSLQQNLSLCSFPSLEPGVLTSIKAAQCAHADIAYFLFRLFALRFEGTNPVAFQLCQWGSI
jgi:hypothetical protein